MLIDQKKLFELYPEYDIVYGPYVRKDGRQHIVLSIKNKPREYPNKIKTISYPKVLMEIYIGRKLLSNETVDHIDRNFNNNSIENLRIIDRKEHAKIDVVRRKKEYIICPICSKEFIPSKNQVNERSKQSLSGPFCSKKCCSENNSRIILKKRIQPRIQIENKYYQLDKQKINFSLDNVEDL